MPITVANAKIYVARILGGGANSQEPLDMAAEAILRSYQDWQSKKYWRFLLKDTSNTTAITGVTVNSGNTTVNAPSTGAFDAVNKGQSVTGTNIPASTTVSSYTRNADGTIATIVLSAAPTGTGAVTLTFGANIPIIAGTNDYNLPLDFYAPFTARTLTNPRTLTWRDQRYWDRVIGDQTVPGIPQDYTTYNPYSALTQNYGAIHMKFDHQPDVNDTLALRYFRRFNTTGTNIDMLDDFLYQFLDYARNVLLATKRANDDPEAYARNAGAAAESAAEIDEEATDDDDADQCMKSGWEMGDWNRPLWGNGQFDPFRY